MTPVIEQEKGTLDSRRHDLDALRASAMLLGIVYHAALSFALGFPWMVQDRIQGNWAFVFQAFVHGFRMPLFFLVSGFFTAMLWRKKGLKSLWRHRFLRVFLPCMLGLVTVVPAMNWAIGYVVGVGAKQSQSAPAASSDSIWAAIQNDDGPEVMRHIELNADLSQLHPEIRVSALTWAAIYDRYDRVQQLLDLGATVDTKNGDGGTALHAAAFFGRSKVVDLLLDRGADIDAKNQSGETPLHSVTLDIGIVQYIANLVGIEIEPQSTKENRQKIAEKLIGLGAIQMPKSSPVAGPSPWSITPLVMWLMYSPTFIFLWFLWFLVWYVLVFSVYAFAVDSSGWSPPFGRFLMKPWSLVLFVAATMVPQWFMGREAWEFGPDTSMGWIPLPHVFLYYGLFFAFGVFYFECDDRRGSLGAGWRWMLPLGVCVLLPVGLGIRSGFVSWYPSSKPWLEVGLQAAYAWVMALGCIGMFRALLDRENRAVRYMSDASYWLYLTHLPVVILLQGYVRSWDLPGPIKLIGVVTVATGGLLLIYDLVVRYSWLGWLLNGKRVRKSSNAGEKESSVVAT